MNNGFGIRVNQDPSYAHWLATMLVGLSVVMSLFSESQPYSPIIGGVAFAMLASRYSRSWSNFFLDSEEVRE